MRKLLMMAVAVATAFCVFGAGTPAFAAATSAWNLDRIDQRNLPLNGQYAPGLTGGGAGVTVYNIDSGGRITHTRFGGRASYGPDYVDGGTSADCLGHGTHTSGTAIASGYGVAYAAKLVEVRVLNCQGSATSQAVKSALAWVEANAHKPAVVNMSLGFVGCTTCGIDEAVNSLISSGVTVVASAGNNGVSACGQTPARVPSVITVGNTTQADARYSTSNYGTCLDIFAPGVGITSTCQSSDTALCSMTGTSMAAPLVTGAAALVLGLHPTYTPAQVASFLTGRATLNKVTNPGSGSPNRLLYVGV